MGLGASLRLDLNPDRTWLTVSLCRLATASQPDGTSVSEDVAAVGGQSPQHHAYRGRLADPVAPDDSEYLARADRHVPVVDGDEGPVDLSDARSAVAAATPITPQAGHAALRCRCRVLRGRGC